MVEGKQIPGLTSAQPAETALARLLKARLVAVAKRCRSLTADAEAIHQLRVSTRRATAALRLAKGYLPARKRQRAITALRDVRRTAGQVRDIDVFLGKVEAAPGIHLAGRAFLLGLRAQRRFQDFQALDAVVKRRQPMLAKLAQRLPGAIEACRETYSELLLRQARRMFLQLDHAAADAGKHLDPEHLHQVRIQTKRLRYSLEMAASPSPRQAALRLHLEKLQETLGQWHDAHGMLPRLASAKEAAQSVNGAAGSPVGKAIQTLTRDNERIEARQLAAFRRWLKSWAHFTRRNPTKVLFPK